MNTPHKPLHSSYVATVTRHTNLSLMIGDKLPYDDENWDCFYLRIFHESVNSLNQMNKELSASIMASKMEH